MNGTYVEINLDNIGKNAKSITEKYNNYNYYIGVIKSDGYGHGKYIVNELYKNGINYFAVSYIDEALEVRKYNKDVSILCLQPISIDDIEKAISNNITIIVHDKNYLDKLLSLNIKSKLNIHIKIDSGMNRLGFKNKNEVKEAYDKINNNENLYLEGIFSHFATIGVFDKYFDKQVENFKELTSLIDLKTIPIVHLGSSVTMLAHPKIDFTTGIRMGIVMYGYNVSPTSSNKGVKNILRNLRNRYYQKKYNISETYSNVKIDLYPAMTMKTKLTQIKNVKKGEVIGYGASYKAEEDIIIGILPIGYSNGIGKLNNGRYVIINNKKYYVLGELGMNMMMIKLDENVNINDEVTILGESITLGQMSRFAGFTISETLLNIGRNNKRVYTKNKKIEYIDESRE